MKSKQEINKKIDKLLFEIGIIIDRKDIDNFEKENYIYIFDELANIKNEYNEGNTTKSIEMIKYVLTNIGPKIIVEIFDKWDN